MKILHQLINLGLPVRSSIILCTHLIFVPHPTISFNWKSVSRASRVSFSADAASNLESTHTRTHSQARFSGCSTTLLFRSRLPCSFTSWRNSIYRCLRGFPTQRLARCCRLQCDRLDILRPSIIAR